jgi:PPOX class probable F420-dependent enzyme
MEGALARSRLAAARAGHLATVTPDGHPHVVVCCFALVGDTVCSAVDAKPKSTTMLQRVRNVASVPFASLLVDHYDDDWSQLWWVRVDGAARVLVDGVARERALDALAAKYEQYRGRRPNGPVVLLDIHQWRTWP